MILSGRLEDWSVADLLHMLGVTHKTASLAVAGSGRSGVLYFKGGAIVDADLTGYPLPGDAQSRVVETIYVLQTLTSGEFAIGAEIPDRPGGDIDVAEVLALASERLGVEEGLRDRGLLDSGALGLLRSVPAPVSIEPAEWVVLSDIVSSFTFDDLEARIGRSGAVAFIGAFERLGILERRGPAVRELPIEAPAAPPVESESRERVGQDPVRDEEPVPHPWTVPDWEPDAVEEPATIEVVVDEPVAEPAGVGADQTGRRREMRSVISPADTTLVPGVLSDIRQRFRTVELPDSAS